MGVIKISWWLLPVCVFATGFFDEALIYKCGREVGLNEGVINLLNGTRDFPVPTEFEELKCYFKCIFQATNWMSYDGKLQVGNFDDENEKEDFEYIVTECMSVKGESPCETAYLFQLCMFAIREEEKEEELEEGEEQPQQEQPQQEQSQQEQPQQEQEQKDQGQQEQGQEEQQEQGQQEKQPDEN